jgi:hypothetical protein
VEDVADQRFDLAINGITEADRAAASSSYRALGFKAHDDLRQMVMRTIPRGRSWAAKEVSEALRGEAVRRLLRAIDGRKIDEPVSPQEIIEEMSGNQRGACDIRLLKGRLDELERLGEWLTEFARLLDLEPGQEA